MRISENVMRSVLRSTPGTAEAAASPSLVAALTDVFNQAQTVFSAQPGLSFDLAVKQALSSLRNLQTAAQRSEAYEYIKRTKETYSKMKEFKDAVEIASINPNKAIAVMTLHMAQEIISAGGLGEIDECYKVTAELAISVILTGAEDVGTGGGAIILTMAPLVLQAYEVEHAWRKKLSGPRVRSIQLKAGGSSDPSPPPSPPADSDSVQMSPLT